MRDFHRLDVWKLAHSLTIDIYRHSAVFPKSEQYGLTSQLRRAAVSIGANLAEGCGRESDADYRRFVQMASGSACEVEYHLLLARDLELIDPAIHKQLDERLNQVKRMLVGLARHLGSEKPERPTVPR